MNLCRMTGLVTCCLMLVWGGPARSQTIVVGGKVATEQKLMVEMTAQLLTARGFSPDRRAGMGTLVLRKALETGQVDICWEYTGNGLLLFNKIKDRLSIEEGYNRLKQVEEEKGFIWLTPSKADATMAIAMPKESASKAGITSLSEFAGAVKSGKPLSIAVSAEFAVRPDGLPGIEKTYGFEMPLNKIRKMDAGLTYQALRDRQVEAAQADVTDPRNSAFDLVLLKDDKEFFPHYALTPVVRKDVLAKYPKLAESLNALSSKLDTPVMIKLNGAVELEKKSVEQVATEFLKQEGLI